MEEKEEECLAVIGNLLFGNRLADKLLCWNKAHAAVSGGWIRYRSVFCTFGFSPQYSVLVSSRMMYSDTSF
jgi:hypothetical protein